MLCACREGTSTGAELVRTCGHAGGACLSEEGDDEDEDGGNDGAEAFLADADRSEGPGGEGGRGLLGCCGLSSGIGILLRCTVRLDGGVYAFAGGSSSLMRCRPTVGLLSCITYWCSSSDSSPELTSAEKKAEKQKQSIMIRVCEASDEARGVWDGWDGWMDDGTLIVSIVDTHRVCAVGASRARLLAGPLVRPWVTRSEW